MGFGVEMLYRDCPWCGVTHAQMRAHVTDVGSRGDETGDDRWYSLLTCPACAGAMVIETTGTSKTAIELDSFPQDNAVNDLPAGLPADVQRYLTDAIKVLRTGVPDAAAVQLRRAIEAAAKSVGIETRRPVEAVEQMVKQGLITASFGGAVHHIRQIGNMGAHATDEQLTQAQVQRALRFMRALLQNLFEIPGELQQLAVAADAEDSARLSD